MKCVNCSTNVMGTRLCHTSQQQLTFVKYGSKREKKAAGVALRTVFERLCFLVWVIAYYSLFMSV